MAIFHFFFFVCLLEGNLVSNTVALQVALLSAVLRRGADHAEEAASESTAVTGVTKDFSIFQLSRLVCDFVTGGCILKPQFLGTFGRTPLSMVFLHVAAS